MASDMLLRNVYTIAEAPDRRPASYAWRGQSLPPRVTVYAQTWECVGFQDRGGRAPWVIYEHANDLLPVDDPNWWKQQVTRVFIPHTVLLSPGDLARYITDTLAAHSIPESMRVSDGL